MADSTIRDLNNATSTDGTATVEVVEQVSGTWYSRKGVLDTLLGITSFGRAILTGASAAAQRNALGLGTASTQATGAFAAASHGHAAADITMATARLLGRTTASAGAAEEIAVGTGLSLVSGTLSATGGGGGSAAFETAFSITYASTITPNRANGRYQRVTITGNPVIAMPTGVPDGNGSDLILFVTQDGTGGRQPTLGAGITGSVGVDTAPNATTILRFVSVDGDTAWIAEGGGTNLGNGQFIGTDQSGTLKALTLRRAIPFGFTGAPANGDVWRAIAPFAGVVRGVRGMAAGSSTPTITGTVAIAGTTVTGLSAQTYGAGGAASLVAATAANVFAAGDLITFTHTASPGGTVTGGCLSVEVEQTA